MNPNKNKTLFHNSSHNSSHPSERASVRAGNSSHHHSKGGFSLIELVFAMSFLTIIVFGVISLQSSNLAMLNSQNQEIQAHFYANQGLQIAKAIGSAAITGDCNSGTCKILPGGSYTINDEEGNPEIIQDLFERSFLWNVNGLTDAILITMNVEWEDGTGEHTVSAKQIIQ